VKKSFWILLAALAPAPAAQALAAQAQPVNAPPTPTELLANPGFESPSTTVYPAGAVLSGKGDITGQVAKGWGDNSGWANVDVNYSLDPDAHGGLTSQRIDVHQINNGAVQFVQTLPVQSGHAYQMSVWLRSDTPAMMSLDLRKSGSPFTTYMSQAVLVTPTWTRATVSGLVPDDGEAYFLIHPMGTGTYWIDDASMTDVTNLGSDAPAKTGDLLPDGSFEAGFGAGWAFRMRGSGEPWRAAQYEFSDPRYALDHTTAADGTTSLRIAIPGTMAAIVTSPPVAINFGRVHTASVALKSDRPNLKVDLAIDGSTLKNTAVVGTTWARYSVSGVLPFSPTTRFTISCWNDARPVTLWMDAAALYEGTQTDYAPANPVELALSTPRPGSVFFDGEPGQINLATSGSVTGARLKVSVTDFYGATTPRPDVPLPAASFNIPPDPLHPRGMFLVHAQVVGKDGTPLSPPVLQSFARLPHPRDLAPETSYFGVHIPLNPAYFAIARAIGARWIRIHDATGVTKWPFVEPERDQWQFVDEGVNGAKGAGLAILGMLDGGPAWASVHPRATSGYFAIYNQPDAPDAPAKWTEYVTKTVGHYKGAINDWEVWNEPWGHNFFNGTPQAYGDLLKLAYPAAHAANPDARIIGIDATINRPLFTTGALAEANSTNFDAFSYHDYDAAFYQGPRPIGGALASAFNAAQAATGTAKPLWITEGGANDIGSWYRPESGGMSAQGQTAWTVRFDVTNMAAGVQHFFYYTLHSDPAYGDHGYCALEHDRSIRPLLAARAVLASLVDGLPAPTRAEPVPGVDAYCFTDGVSRTVTVLWGYAGGDHLVPVPAHTRVLDVMGNPSIGKATVTVGLQPVYFVPGAVGRDDVGKK